MNNSVKVMLLAAAGTGLMSGTTTVQPTPLQNGQTLSSARLGQMPLTIADNAKHDCKGMNSCKGQGGCATSDMGCKGKNSCKGKGGCKVM